MEYQNFKSTTLAADLAAGETSTATLSAGNFTAFTDGYLVVDYDNPTKREVMRCTVSGTAVSSMTRGQDGTSDVAHTSGAKVIWALTAVHLNQFASGWIQCNEAWAYATASTITVPTGATAKYSVGDKIRIKQGAGYKYFYVTAVAATVLTVTGGSDYTVADAAITDNDYSKSSSPVGFPQWFSYTPTITVAGGTAPTYTEIFSNRFCINGRTLTLKTYWKNTTGGTAGAGAGSIIYTAPVNAVDIYATGAGWAYETAGTITLVAASVPAVGTLSFTLTNGTNLTGNDQSADIRIVQSSITYEI